MDEFGSIADSYRSIWGIDACVGVLIEELSERLQRTQYANARAGCNCRLPACGNVQGIALVHVACQRLEDVDWIRCILRDCNLADIGLCSTTRRLKVGVAGMKLPGYEVLGEDGVLCAVDGLLNDI